jgi:hypothetical protein
VVFWILETPNTIKNNQTFSATLPPGKQNCTCNNFFWFRKSV